MEKNLKEREIFKREKKNIYIQYIEYYIHSIQLFIPIFTDCPLRISTVLLGTGSRAVTKQSSSHGVYIWLVEAGINKQIIQ